MSDIRQVAKRAGVSSATVSHVINNTRFVSDDVRSRVNEAIRELNYQPNALARSLRRGQTHTIALVLPDSANPFFAEIGRHIERIAFDRGYSVIFCNTEGQPAKENFYLDVVVKKRVDGVILVSVGIPGTHLQQLEAQNVPLVIVDRQSKEYSIDTVLTDNLRGGLLATQHLIRLGHRRIACITGSSTLNPSYQRFAGYEQALREAGLEFDPGLHRTGDFHAASGWEIGLELLRRARPPSAIFACNDMMAIGVLRAASEAGLRVPEDLALVGFDDIELALYTNPPLTTVSQDKARISEIAFDMLMRRVEDRETKIQIEFLQPALVVRRSCGAQLSAA